MAKCQVLYFQRGARPKPSDERIADQSAKIAQRAKASPESQFLASHFEFAAGTRDDDCCAFPVINKTVTVLSSFRYAPRPLPEARDRSRFERHRTRCPDRLAGSGRRQEPGTAGAWRRVWGTRPARRLYRSGLDRLADLAGRIRPELRGRRPAAHDLQRHAGQPANSGFPGRAANRRRRRSGARHRAERPLLLHRRHQRRVFLACLRTVSGRARGGDPAPNRFGAGHPHLHRRASAQGLRHLQFRG